METNIQLNPFVIIIIGVSLSIVGMLFLLGIFSMKVVNKKEIKEFKPFKFPKLVKATYVDGIMTLEYDNGEIKQYEGSVTVWHKLPLMERCNTDKEFELCQYWKYIKHWGNDYPTAHLKQK